MGILRLLSPPSEPVTASAPADQIQDEKDTNTAEINSDKAIEEHKPPLETRFYRDSQPDHCARLDGGAETNPLARPAAENIRDAKRARDNRD